MQELLKTTKAYRLLQKEGERGFSHAYLLCFPDGKLLRDAVKPFAKLLLGCGEPKTAEENRRATLVDEESFVDCLFYPEKGKKLLVEDAERIVEESTLAPVEGEKKLFVLSDFAEANAQTQNKLLKILEEPPKGVTFLLGATSLFPVLSTVLSRAKQLEIAEFSSEEIVACLRRTFGAKYDAEAFQIAAAASGGTLSEAFDLLEGGKQRGLLNDAFALLLSPAYKLPALCKTLGETPYKKELLRLLRLLCRDALLQKRGDTATLLLQTESVRLREVADAYETAALLFAQEALSQAEKELQFNTVFSQCVELFAAKLRKENEKIRAYA